MKVFNALISILYASSLVIASPVGRRSLDKRQVDGNVVWITVTQARTVTIHRGNHHQVTKTVTFHASLIEPAQRAAITTAAPIQVVPAPAPVAAITTSSVAIEPLTPVVAAAIVETPSAPVATPLQTGSGTTPNGPVLSGQGTFYSPGLGSCGDTNADTDFICAISHGLYDSIPNGGNPNNSPFCGRQIRASRGGKSVVVKVVDRCEGCQTDDLDFSPSAFDQIALESEGRVDITWEWIS